MKTSPFHRFNSAITKSSSLGILSHLYWAEPNFCLINYTSQACNTYKNACKWSSYFRAVTIIKKTRFGEIIGFYCENHTKYVNIPCEQQAEFLNVEAGGTYKHLTSKTLCPNSPSIINVTVYVEAAFNPSHVLRVHLQIPDDRRSGPVTKGKNRWQAQPVETNKYFGSFFIFPTTNLHQMAEHAIVRVKEWV